MKFEMTDAQKAEFITESNAIEEIYHEKAVASTVLAGGSTKLPEINGQIDALKMIEAFVELKIPFIVDNVTLLHYTLMRGLLPSYDLGIRTQGVSVGGRMCPYPIQILPMLENWCEKMNRYSDIQFDEFEGREKEVMRTHLAFESIHPFIDGNGRTGRLLLLWLRYKHGLGYDVIKNETKHKDYYPQFKTFEYEKYMCEAP